MKLILFNTKLTFKRNYLVILLLISSIIANVFGISLVYGIAMTSYEIHEDGELSLSLKIVDNEKWINASSIQQITYSTGELKFNDEMIYYGDGNNYKNFYGFGNIIFHSDNSDIQKKIDNKENIIWMPSSQARNINIGDSVTISNTNYEVVGYSLRLEYAIDVPYYSDLIDWTDSNVGITISGVASQINKYRILNDLGAKQVPHSTGGYVVYLIMALALTVLAFFLIGKLFQKMLSNSLPIINVYRMLGAKNWITFASLFIGNFLYLVVGIVLGVVFSIKYTTSFLKTIIIYLYPTDFWIISILVSLSAITTFALAIATVLKKNIKESGA